MEYTVDSRRRIRSLLLVFSAAATFLVLLWGAVQTAFISPLTTAGYKDFSYDDPELPIGEKLNRVTAEKPESKLWWNDGYWWGVLYNRDTDHYHIYRLNWGDNEWVDTGVQVDDRRADPFALPPKPAENVRVDVLWDQATQKLYVASHIAKDNGSYTSDSQNRGNLFRYSYDKEAQAYILDTLAGFLPEGIQLNKHKSSTLVLAKDSTGRLWSSFVARKQGEAEYKALVTYSNGGETLWERDGFAMPFTQTVVSGKDISTIFAFNNHGVPSIGVLWTNEVSSTIHLAIHPDNASPTSGWTYESVPDPYGIDNHIAVRTNAAGQIFIAVKMKPAGANDPQIAVIARDKDISGTWTYAGYSTKTNDDTRPTLLIDEGDPLIGTDDQLYVFATGREGGSDVCYKTSSIDQTKPLTATLSFKSGDCGTPIMMDNILDRIDDASTTKQNVNKDMGVAVIGSDDVNGKFYVHNTIGNPIPVAFPFGPARNAVDVLPTAPISATFNKPMKDSTIDGSSFYVEDGNGQKLAGTVIYDSSTRTAYFYPTLPLHANATYTAKFTQDVRDTGNVQLNAGIETAVVREQWSFTAMSPTVQFDSISYSVLENEAQATITLTLSADSDKPVSVDYATADITAGSSVDYTSIPSTTITFAAHEITKTFTVDILDDALAEGNEDIRLALSNPISASLGLDRIATLTIFDNETPPTVQFDAANFNAAEGSGQAQVRVSLFPTTTVSVNVDIATVDGMG
ncbi:MAG: Ig-like domain-containing protein, partial [Anaerolineales bacterium]|nr:Ig-like domain-containing protein [Anaerolineales bacterium]